MTIIAKGALSPHLLRLVPGKDPRLVLDQFYFLVCVPFRFALYSVVYLLRNHPSMPWVVGLAGLVSCVHLLRQPFDIGQWWSRRFQLVLSILVVMSCVLVVAKKVPTWVVPVLLYLSVAGGLFQKWMVKQSC